MKNKKSVSSGSKPDKPASQVAKPSGSQQGKNTGILQILESINQRALCQSTLENKTAISMQGRDSGERVVKMVQKV